LIGIVNYGSGNVDAVANIYKRLNIDYEITGDTAVLERSSHLILPGVGAFDETMRILYDTGLKSFLDIMVLQKQKLVMGICIGMQLLAEGSEEGELEGFGWIKGKVKRLDSSKLQLKPHLPHLGWNTVEQKYEHPIFKNIDQNKGFYFLHSFYYDCSRPEDVLGTTDYGINFASAVRRDNIFGMQFHPEKSHDNGVSLFRNFSTL